MESHAPVPLAPVTTSQGVKLIFELTNLCNFHCTYCIRSEEEPHDYLDLEVVEKILTEVRPYHNVSHVTFTGGEPTLHPRFADIVRLVTTHGYPFGFVTHGWQFDKTLAIVKPNSSALKYVTFSVDGATEMTHDTLRRRPGSFRRLMQAISLCRFHGIAVYLNMVVTRANQTEVEAMAMLASRLGCGLLAYGHCQPTPDGVAADLILSVPERRQVEADIAALQSMFQMPIFLAGDHYEPSRFYQCSQLQMREFNIDYRGYLTACCNLSHYRGGKPDTEALADLHTVSFYEGHRRLLDKIHQINQEKIVRLATQAPSEAEQFMCTHCLLHYEKVPQLVQLLTPCASSSRPAYLTAS
jgi:MoaA/NifB/PqqE/SkfB family radical SAM enzyme